MISKTCLVVLHKLVPSVSLVSSVFGQSSLISLIIFGIVLALTVIAILLLPLIALSPFLAPALLLSLVGLSPFLAPPASWGLLEVNSLLRFLLC